MTTNVAVQEQIDLTPHTPNAMNGEAKRLLKLYWILDNWMEDVESIEVQKIHAHLLRSQLDRLVDYYLDRGQRNKAKLAVTLSDAACIAEEHGLTYNQINVIQMLLIYFQRVNLTINDLKHCDRSLVDHNIYTLPALPNWQAAIADH